jgi:hypothetical protein
MKALLLGLMAASTLVTAAVAQPVDQREMNQHQRIEQGVASGQLNRHEARRLERHERRIRFQEARMRSRHGGMLTPHQRARLEREQNHASRDIYRLKHNDRGF